MIRIVIENAFLFLLPTAVYFAYHYFTQGEARSARRAMDEAPLFALLASGAAVMMAVLFLFSQSTTGGKPGQHYEPPVLKGGRIEPGRIE